ncbi:uncharacterized protein PHACADRAFT_183721 [Phanerochaete carnosa HHB-10118-sp]|uniref:VIT domain-containing protein n=1 Tax=Phanerochaete carnosa (strain HHB-10118-sp) TaxID=650164 RepID=K5V3T4_PHACS|nr:uncharacterized protein PHACADRAFT_183721 [Phanerochaete carnosa HHB-10118-sp]EKM57246.1 hypothetical protein PHACADRAFT_183721 [Phanerochaete carnosa HHB-10118-sp]
MQLPTSTSARPCGIVYILPDLSEAYLPLEKADIHVNIVDVSAIVTFTQNFWQYSSDGLQKAKYIFPVPARAAVCGFEMTTEDGTVIAAVAKEKEEAKREHEQAISQGRMTGLVEQVTDDIFSISLGALPSHQMIQAQTTYVLDLMDEDISYQVRLQIPMYIGMRYGNLPEGMQGAKQISPHRVSISADIQMQSTVKNITSPTHPTVIISDSGSAYTLRNARYISEDFLAQDFVLSVTAEGLDAPRCFAQKMKNGATAIQLNIVPKFNLPSISRQEYIFLVDRSGSMDGSKIETAKKTLVMLLRALPSQGTHFNIFSFGSHCDSLWPQSIPYDGKTLDEATRHVDTMYANYGGTEIQSALQQVFNSRKTDKPTACFVLTDGETYNIDHTISTVDLAVKQASPSAPLRVFTLGIGTTTSSAMCEGISRAGNGVCLMATTTESIIGKCSKLVRASRTYILKNVSVDWGVHTNLLEAYRTGNTELKSIRQAPAQVSAIYPGTRLIVFALIDYQSYTPPNEVMICAQRDGQGEVLQFSVPIQVVEFPSDSPHGRLIPTLAARRAIMDLEDDNRGLLSPDVKATIVKLGTEYQLASRYTSFVAVDRRTKAEVEQEQPRQEPFSAHQDPENNFFKPFPQATSASIFSGLQARVAAPPAPPPPPGIFGPYAASALPSSAAPAPPPASGAGRVTTFGSSSGSATQTSTPSKFSLFGSSSLQAPPPPPPPPPPARGAGRVTTFGSPSGGATQTSTPSEFSLFGSSPSQAPTLFGAVQNQSFSAPSPSLSTSSSLFSAPPVTHLQSIPCGFMPQAMGRLTGAAPVPPAVSEEERSLDESSLSTEDKVLKLVRLQSFDGSFSPTVSLENLVGKTCLAEATRLQIDQKVWATVLAVAFLKKYMKDQPELLDGLVEKAMDYLSETSGVDIDALLTQAENFVV